MMKKSSVKCLLMLIGAMVSFVFSAKIQVLPIQSAGITEELQKTVESLVRISVTSAGQYTIIRDDRGDYPPVGKFSIVGGANFGTY